MFSDELHVRVGLLRTLSLKFLINSSHITFCIHFHPKFLSDQIESCIFLFFLSFLIFFVSFLSPSFYLVLKRFMNGFYPYV